MQGSNAIRRCLTGVALLVLGSPCLAQVSDMGTTAMGLPTTPGVVTSSPLNGPSPFSALTQPGMPDTTLAPVPLASDPTTPGTVVTCSSSAGQGTPSTPSALSTISSLTGATTTIASAANSGSATGAVLPSTLLGSSTLSSTCSSGTTTPNPAALPLSLPAVANVPAAGALQSAVARLADSTIDPTIAVPTPNASACSESVSMNLTAPGMMAPANVTGAAATPGVAPTGC
jgi:hypothetical protein